MKAQFNRMLSTFFALESVLNGLEFDGLSVFGELSKVYLCEDKTEINKAYDAYENLKHKNGYVRTQEEYYKLMRTIEYCKLMNLDDGYTEYEKELLILKGLSLCTVTEGNLLLKQRAPSEESIRLLDEGTQNGELNAFLLLGFMLVNGIAVEKDFERGVRLFKKGARWNNLDCALMYLRYDGANSESLSIVKAICLNDSTRECLSLVKRAYPQTSECKPLREAGLISKYFSLYPEGKKRYDAQVARIAYSAELSYLDKTKLLYTESRVLLGQANSLPIGDVFRGEYSVPSEIYNAMLIKREKEWRRIWVRLGNLDMRRERTYKPILLVCEDEFVLETYRRAISQIYDGAVISVDAGSLDGAALSATTENYLLDGVTDSKDMNALFMVDNVEKLPEQLIGSFARQLSSAYTSAFLVGNVGGVSLDLSGTVQVLFSTEKAKGELKEAVDVIELMPVSEQEKGKVLNFLIAKWGAKCGVSFTLPEKSEKRLLRFNATEMEAVIAELSLLAKSTKNVGESFVPDESLVDECSDRLVPAKSVLGF